jgi:hypothetical protein
LIHYDSWGFIENDRLLLSDKYGKLILLTMLRSRESKKIESMGIDDLGEVSDDLVAVKSAYQFFESRPQRNVSHI